MKILGRYSAGELRRNWERLSMKEIERHCWMDFQRRETASSSRPGKTRAKFSQSVVYEYAERLVDAGEALPGAWVVVVDFGSIFVPAAEADYWRRQPLQPENLCFNCFSWRQDERHREQAISLRALSRALWIIERRHEEGTRHEDYEKKLRRLTTVADKSSLAPRLERLNKRHRESADLLKPSIVTDADGNATVRWDKYDN